MTVFCTRCYVFFLCTTLLISSHISLLLFYFIFLLDLRTERVFKMWVYLATFYIVKATANENHMLSRRNFWCSHPGVRISVLAGWLFFKCKGCEKYLFSLSAKGCYLKREQLSTFKLSISVKNIEKYRNSSEEQFSRSSVIIIFFLKNKECLQRKSCGSCLAVYTPITDVFCSLIGLVELNTLRILRIYFQYFRVW